MDEVGQVAMVVLETTMQSALRLQVDGLSSGSEIQLETLKTSAKKMTASRMLNSQQVEKKQNWAGAKRESER